MVIATIRTMPKRWTKEKSESSLKPQAWNNSFGSIIVPVPVVFNGVLSYAGVLAVVDPT